MKIAPVNQMQGIGGTEAYGAMKNVRVAAQQPAHIHPGTEMAPPSGNKYEGKSGICTHINENGIGCSAPRAKETDFCIGHLRKIEKALKAKEAAENKENE
jgi:hypothetical protein